MRLVLIVVLGLLVVTAAGLVIGSRLVERGAERAFPAAGRMVDAGAGRLHVLEAGRPDRPAVVLIHGANGAVGDWAGVTALLGDRFRVLAIDRPGHGYSPRPGPGPWTASEQAAAIRAGLKALGVERPILVGFSWGGTVATAMALDHPEEVAGVVTSGAPFADWTTGVNIAYRLPTWPVIGPAFAYGLAPLAGKALGDAWAAPAFSPEKPTESFAKAPWPLALRTTTYLANAEDIAGLSDFLAIQKKRYPGFKPPIVIIHGDGDQVVSLPIHARAAAAAIPGAVLQVEKGAGHMIPYTRPEVIAAAVERLAAAR